jgi:hypothetical protein
MQKPFGDVMLLLSDKQYTSQFPEWLAGSSPDSKGNTDKTNAWIYETCRDQPWSMEHERFPTGEVWLNYQR